MALTLTFHISFPWPFSLRAALKNHKLDITAEKPVLKRWWEHRQGPALQRQLYLVNFRIFNYCQFPGLFNEKVHGSSIILHWPRALQGTPSQWQAQQAHLEYLEKPWEQDGRGDACSSFQAMWINFGIIQRLINSRILLRPQGFHWIRCVNQTDNVYKLSCLSVKGGNPTQSILTQ